MAFPPSTTVRTAIDLKNAIDNAANSLRPIGFCPTISERWRKNQYGSPWDDEEMDDSDNEEGDNKKMAGCNALMKQLGQIKEEHHSPAYIGDLETPFSLTINRAGCEFTGEITPKTQSTAGENPDEKDKAAAKEATAAFLKKLYDGGAISGYGDVRAQETKVDPSVRNAREIPAAEFTVAPELFDSIQKHWAAHFFPTLVRIEPYKIHLYGPGGMFKEHRDTPETNLVGTFLLGIGDTTSRYAGGLCVKGTRGWECANANPCTWVAFYPDVKHEVTEIAGGYRAVIAFKVFRLPDKVEDPTKSVVQVKIKDVLDKMPTKYGLLLERQYCKGTTQLSGFDAHLLAAARARADVETHILPVLTKFDASKDEYDGGGDDDSAETSVYPLMEPHVDALVKLYANSALSSDSSDSEEDEDEKKKSLLEISLKGTEAAWIEECKVSKVPFFSPDLHNSLVVWRQIEEQGAEHTGNEAKPTTEDSIYLSYAMVVLPKKGEKRKREVNKGKPKDADEKNSTS